MESPECSPATIPDEEWLTLNYVSKLFGSDSRTIKSRAARGDFDIRVDGSHIYISRASVNRHMRELEERHARRG